MSLSSALGLVTAAPSHALSSDATVTSTIGIVNSGGGTISDVPYGTTLVAFKAAITPAAGATWDVYEGDGVTLATVLATGKFIYAAAEDGLGMQNYLITVLSAPNTEITVFDAIANVAAGTAGSATYADAAAVIADLPATATADTAAVTVPVTTWVDTDTYDSTTAGSYTFTATLGTLPAGWANTGAFTATVEVVVAAVVVATEITVFDAIANVAAGTAGSATYADAAAVIADLPATATADTAAVTVPVTTWVDTDTYDSTTAGSYTFTATLGTLPAGWANTGAFTATVEVVVAAVVVVPITHTVTYTPDGLNGSGTPPQTLTIAEGDTYTAAANTFTYAGHTFWVWSENGVGIYPGNVRTMLNADIVLSATWALNTEITGFDSITAVAAGTAGSATYANAAAVIGALPLTATANAGVATIPTTSWVDTDGYDSTTAGSYTFTASLTALPYIDPNAAQAAWINTGAFTATVEVVVADLAPTTYTVTYTLDGEYGAGTAPDSLTLAVGDTFTVAANTFTYEGHTFWYWGWGANGVDEGTVQTMGNHDILLYATWVENTEITAFDAIANVAAGTAGSATYANAAAVLVALPSTVTANTSAVTVPVITWLDTDTYNPAVAGSYTFTASLGALPPLNPEGPLAWGNSGTFTATVEVVVAAAVVVVTPVDVPFIDYQALLAAKTAAEAKAITDAQAAAAAKLAADAKAIADAQVAADKVVADAKAAAEAEAIADAQKAADLKASEETAAVVAAAANKAAANTIKIGTSSKKSTKISLDLADKYYSFIVYVEVGTSVKGVMKYSLVDIFAVAKEDGTASVLTKKLVKGQVVRVRLGKGVIVSKKIA